MVFNGTRKAKGRGLIYTKNYTTPYAYKFNEKTAKKYRFFAQAISHEDVDWDGTEAGAAKVKPIDHARTADDYNMLIFTVEDVSHSETIYV